MADPRTMTPFRTGTQSRLADELAVPAFVVGSVVARGRRTMARSRRLPGLSLCFLGAVRGLAKTPNAHVPALPWSKGFSPALLWGWAGRGDEGAASSVVPSPPLSPGPKVAAFGPVVRGVLGADVRRGDAVPPVRVVVARSAERPALLHRNQARLVDPGAPSSRPGRAESAPPAIAPVPRADRGFWGFALDVMAARPASVRTEVLPVTRDAAPRVPASRAPAREPSASLAAHADRTAELPWAEPVPRAVAAAPSAEGRAVLPPGAERARMATGPFAGGDVLPWSVPSLVRPAHQRAEQPLLLLPELDTNAGPVALKAVVEVAETLRTLVTRETREVKEAIARASQQPAPAPASATPTDDVARKLLRRMRTLSQEERFRSGKLR